ncbi:31995_t:CDS:2 [Gigaspora margarita]|uniref:31995_t:CDS:1 n=1 Tax=Gigaspora margarita TaxID=4874 RepID=A0ABM8W606_GIGMA|nr:31995_t:CDS:2 [Gigaspora margarita]
MSASGTTLTTNVSRSQVDNWIHTYDIAGAAGEAEEPDATIIKPHFGAKLEYRIGFDITKQVLAIIN